MALTVEVVETMMAKLLQANMDMMTKMLEKKDSGGGGGNGGKDGIGRGGKIPEFHGKEAKYAEWIIKMTAYFKVHLQQSERYLAIAMNADTEQNDEAFEKGDGDWMGEDAEDVKKFSSTLYSVLINNTSDDAFTICNSTKTCQGLEAIRLLRRRYDPKSPRTKRAILKGIMNLGPAKKLSELERTILKLEEMVTKYESMSKVELPEDLIIITMIDLCHKELREHLELNNKSMKKSDVREEIFSYIERTRNAVKDKFDTVEGQGIHYMNNQGGEMWEDDGGSWGWPEQERPQEDLQYFGGKGEDLQYFGGKGGGKSFGGKNQGKGFQWDPKGKGKSAPKGGYTYGKGFESGGKGGKGKAKGGFQGDCFWCGKFGHSQRDCPNKDAYMSWVRKGKGKGEEVHSVEEKPEFSNLERMEYENPNKCHQLCGSLERWTAGDHYLPLSSLNTVNRWSILSRDEDAAEDYETTEPPGLHYVQSCPKKKMPRVKKWAPKRDKQVTVVKSEMQSELQYCCGPSGLGVPATWGVRLSDGFKSSGKYNTKNEHIEEPVLPMIELSNIEEIFEICNIENEGHTGDDGEGEFIDFTVDSGAADTVANENVASKCPTVPSEGSRKGVKYVAAAGTVISNDGEKNVKTQTAEGHLCGIKIQIAKVNKALLSVSKICDAGHEVTFNRTGGRIIHSATGQVVNFRRVDGVYRLRVKVVRETGSGFTRPGM